MTPPNAEGKALIEVCDTCPKWTVVALGEAKRGKRRRDGSFGEDFFEALGWASERLSREGFEYIASTFRRIAVTLAE